MSAGSCPDRVEPCLSVLITRGRRFKSCPRYLNEFVNEVGCAPGTKSLHDHLTINSVPVLRRSLSGRVGVQAGHGAALLRSTSAAEGWLAGSYLAVVPVRLPVSGRRGG